MDSEYGFSPKDKLRYHSELYARQVSMATHVSQAAALATLGFLVGQLGRQPDGADHTLPSWTVVAGVTLSLISMLAGMASIRARLRDLELSKRIARRKSSINAIEAGEDPASEDRDKETPRLEAENVADEKKKEWSPSTWGRRLMDLQMITLALTLLIVALGATLGL